MAQSCRRRRGLSDLARGADPDLIANACAPQRVVNEGEALEHRHADTVGEFDRGSTCAAFRAIDHDEIRNDARLQHGLDHAHEFTAVANAQFESDRLATIDRAASRQIIPAWARSWRLRNQHFLQPDPTGGSKSIDTGGHQSGYVESIRGRNGGIRLGKAPEDINIGALVRRTEGGFELVDCGNCIVAPACRLTGMLKEALSAFLAVLDRYSLADLVTRPEDFALIFDSVGRSPELANP